MVKSILLYEDEVELRNFVESVISKMENEFILLASFSYCDNVLKHISEFTPDIVIMDIQLSGDEDGLHALYKIKKVNQAIKVMIFTTFDNDEKILNAISLGADGYMLKSDFFSYALPQEALRKSLKIIFEGGAYLTPSIAKQIITLFSIHSIGNLIEKAKIRFNTMIKNESKLVQVNPKLTKMQILVLEKISEGLTTAEIAEDLHLSQNTINTHIKGIYTTLGVHSRTKAVKKAIESKLIKYNT